MKNEAVALCRVSTLEQRVDGNSLDSQQRHVYEFAENKLECKIEQAWRVDVSSKAGKNIKRKDLMEIREYCRKNRHIKYFIVDKVNRLMREVDYFYWFLVELKNLGVKTYFADPSQQDLNNGDDYARFKMFLEIYAAEKDNKDRAETTLARMKDRTLSGYYIFPLHQGYKTSKDPGLHVPNGDSFELLQKALRNVAAGVMDKHEAFVYLTKSGYKTPSGKELRIDVFNEILVDDYYAGFITIERWGEKFHGIKGLHVPMITEIEHENIKNYMKSKKTVIRKQHNPEFPLSSILYCECGGKFVGLMQGNGKGNFYPRYRCRKCGRQLRRENLHAGTEKLVKEVKFADAFTAKISTAMEQVWREEEKQNLTHVNTLNRRKIDLEEAKTSLIIELTKNPELSADFKLAIEKIKADLLEVDARIADASKIENDLVDFMAFGLDFIKNKQDKIWDLEFDDLQRFKQLVFPGEIYVDSSEKVCTHQISPILCLKGIKKEVQNTSNSIMVGPVGFEPTTNRL